MAHRARTALQCFIMTAHMCAECQGRTTFAQSEHKPRYDGYEHDRHPDGAPLSLTQIRNIRGTRKQTYTMGYAVRLSDKQRRHRPEITRGACAVILHRRYLGVQRASRLLPARLVTRRCRSALILINALPAGEPFPLSPTLISTPHVYRNVPVQHGREPNERRTCPGHRWRVQDCLNNDLQPNPPAQPSPPPHPFFSFWRERLFSKLKSLKVSENL